MENHTAKHFVLQLGSLVSMYLSLSFLLVLIFGITNIIFPADTDTIWEIENASSQIRIGIAMTIVFFPTYILLTRYVAKTRRSDQAGSYLGLTKWLIYLSLLFAGAALLADLVVVINAFLEGEITARFITKALLVLIIIGAAFYYYLQDAKGYWLRNEKQSVIFGSVAVFVALISITLGFSNIKTPLQVREQKLDISQLSDLQNMQWQIQNYLVIEGSLPQTIEAAYEGMTVPHAPEGRPAYLYKVTENGFELCATFVNQSLDEEQFVSRPILNSNITNPDNWDHGTGEWCFNRIVNSNG